jgi:integrase/recombinase XerC
MTPTTSAQSANRPHQQHQSWLTMSGSERKRAATQAANTRDADTLIELALDHIEHQRRRPASDSTRHTYAWALRHLLDAWAHVPILQPTSADADTYRAEIERAFTVSTVYVCLAAAGALYRALRWAGATNAHPWADVRVEKRDNRKQHQRRAAFTSAEIEQLLNHATDPAGRALVLLGAHAGLRMREMLKLRWRDIEWDADPPHLQATSNTGTRLVTLTPALAQALDELLNHAVVNVSDDIEPVLPWRSPEGVRKHLRLIAERAGVTLTSGKSVTSLRHAYGTELYARTGDLLAVAERLGHSTTYATTYIDRASETAASRLNATRSESKQP